MKAAAAELNDGGDNSAKEEIEESSGSSSEDSTSADEGENGVKDKWIDECDEGGDEDEAAPSQPKKSKGKRKVLSCVEKVRKVQPFGVDLH